MPRGVRWGIQSGMPSAKAVSALRDAFRTAGIDTFSLDARVLAAAALGTDAAGLLAHPDRVLNGGEAAELAGFAARRLAREPVARNLGRAEFWGLPFRLSPATLVPRPDTETLVEAALASVGDSLASLSIIDLGTGTGCILIALLSELRAAWGLGTDRSDEALGTAWGNALRNGVANRTLFAASDWGAAIAGRFDLLVANPPYIPSRSVRHLAPEVAAHDPAAALDGGGDGLDAYRRLFADVPGLLRPGGRAFVEIGFDQADGTADLARRAGLAVDRVVADLAGHRRVLVLKER